MLYAGVYFFCSFLIQLYVVLVWCTVISILCINIIQRKKRLFYRIFFRNAEYISKLITRGDGKHRAHAYIYRTEQNTSKKISMYEVMNRVHFYLAFDTFCCKASKKKLKENHFSNVYIEHRQTALNMCIFASFVFSRVLKSFFYYNQITIGNVGQEKLEKN